MIIGRLLMNLCHECVAEALRKRCTAKCSAVHVQYGRQLNNNKHQLPEKEQNEVNIYLVYNTQCSAHTIKEGKFNYYINNSWWRANENGKKDRNELCTCLGLCDCLFCVLHEFPMFISMRQWKLYMCGACIKSVAWNDVLGLQWAKCGSEMV